jgi:Holliday junction resolvase RusA-like endonuclease
MSAESIRPRHSRKFAQHSPEWAEACNRAFERAMEKIRREKPQTLTLPWPVSVNELYRAVSFGNKPRNILSARARLFYEAAKGALLEQKAFLMQGPVDIAIQLAPPTKRVFDADGKLKATLDALVHAGVLQDDSWKFIKRTTYEVVWDAGFIGARVTITPWEKQPNEVQ